LVVQKEVAERWTALSGASLATVAVQVFAHAKTLLTIPASAFTPPLELKMLFPKEPPHPGRVRAAKLHASIVGSGTPRNMWLNRL